jgi:hypothetical protein
MNINENVHPHHYIVRAAATDNPAGAPLTPGLKTKQCKYGLQGQT